MYQEILGVWKKERTTDSLCSLASDFFIRAQVCFTQMEKRPEYNLFNDIISHRIQYLLEDLIQLRITKLLTLLTSSKSASVPFQALTRVERDFVKGFSTLFQNIFDNQLNDLNTSLNTVSKDENQVAPLALETQKEEEKEPLALIRIIRPIPAFVDTDGLLIGPLATGDIIHLSRELAYKILIPKGAAVEIETD